MEIVNAQEISKNTVNFPVVYKFKTATLRKKIISTYLKLGETNESIEAINILAMEYFRELKKTRYFEEIKKSTVGRMLASRSYQRQKIIDNGLLGISIHVMQKGDVIPMHAHPGKFNLTVVDQGEFKIKYLSLGNPHALAASEQQLKLHSNQVSSGLPEKNNLHEIQATSETAVFFSVRVELRPRKSVLEKFIYQQNFLRPGLLMGLVLPFLTVINLAHAKDFGAYGLNQSGDGNIIGQINVDTTAQYRQRAEKLRLTNDYASQVEAVKYYEKAAYGGDAESQYWLGVMYLDGSGITEDDDLALEWISNAANQNYPPAEKLLSHLLATEFDMEC